MKKKKKPGEPEVSFRPFERGKPKVEFRPITYSGEPIVPPEKKKGITISPPSSFDKFNQRNAAETRRLFEGLASASYCSQLKKNGKDIGFRHVEAGPLVRSSFHAASSFDSIFKKL